MPCPIEISELCQSRSRTSQANYQFIPELAKLLLNHTFLICLHLLEYISMIPWPNATQGRPAPKKGIIMSGTGDSCTKLVAYSQYELTNSLCRVMVGSS